MIYKRICTVAVASALIYAFFAYAPTYVPLPGGVANDAVAGSRFTRTDLKKAEAISRRRANGQCMRRELKIEGITLRQCITADAGPCTNRAPARRDAANCEASAIWTIGGGRKQPFDYEICHTTYWYHKVRSGSRWVISYRIQPWSLWNCIIYDELPA